MTDLLKYADAAVVPHHGGVPLMDRSAQALLYVRLSVCDPSVHLGAFFPFPQMHSALSRWRIMPSEITQGREKFASGASAISKGTSQTNLTRITGNSLSV